MLAVNNIKFFVINLDSSLARWKKISTDLDNASLDYKRVSAIHGKSINWHEFSDDKFCRSYMGRSMQPGEVGCFLSHIKALKEFIHQGDDFAVILEDDANISRNFLTKVNSIINNLNGKEFYAVNLGPSDYKYSTKMCDLEPGKLYCTHRFPMLATGILWSRLGAINLVDKFELVSLPYDNYLRLFLTGTNKVFSIYPRIVQSTKVDSDIDAAGLTSNRSSLNKSSIYRLLKQKRSFREKCLAFRSMIKFRLQRIKND
jgi:glycosyl transferase family 25